jgi:hypothetical protein
MLGLAVTKLMYVRQSGYLDSPVILRNASARLAVLPRVVTCHPMQITGMIVVLVSPKVVTCPIGCELNGHWDRSGCQWARLPLLAFH